MSAPVTTGIETVVDVQIETHRICECIEVSLFHAPGRCRRDGDETCVKCGRQVCDECYYRSTGLCITCDGRAA